MIPTFTTAEEMLCYPPGVPEGGNPDEAVPEGDAAPHVLLGKRSG